MIVRRVNLDRARAAAEIEIAKLAQPEPTSTGPTNPQADPFKGRAELGTNIQTTLKTVSAKVAITYGDNWTMSDVEARDIASPIVEVIELEFGSLTGKPWNRVWIAVGLWLVPRVLTYLFGVGKSPTLTPPPTPTNEKPTEATT